MSVEGYLIIPADRKLAFAAALIKQWFGKDVAPDRETLLLAAASVSRDVSDISNFAKTTAIGILLIQDNADCPIADLLKRVDQNVEGVASEHPLSIVLDDDAKLDLELVRDDIIKAARLFTRDPNARGGERKGPEGQGR